MAVIYKAGDISLTYSGIFFWITSGAVLSKLRFFSVYVFALYWFDHCSCSVVLFSARKAKGCHGIYSMGEFNHCRL